MSNVFQLNQTPSMDIPPSMDTGSLHGSPLTFCDFKESRNAGTEKMKLIQKKCLFQL